MKKQFTSYTRWKAGLILFLAILGFQAMLFLPRANAVSFNKVMVRLDRLSKSTATTGTVCAEPSVAGDAEASVVLTFPAGFTVGASWTTDTTTTTGWPSGATAWTTIQATGTGSGQTATFTSGNLASSSQIYCFNWTNNTALTNPSTTGSYAITVTTKDAGSATLESNTATTSIVDTNCGAGSTPCDQIKVTASVNQSFTFSLASNASSIGALSASSPTDASPINATVSTNAQAGWQMWSADTTGNTGLKSTISGHTIGYSPSAGSAASALSTGVEGFNMGADTATGTTCTSVSLDNNYKKNGVAHQGGGLDGTLRTVATSSGVADACSVPLIFSASISNTTPAATDYTTTATIVAAGMF